MIVPIGDPTERELQRVDATQLTDDEIVAGIIEQAKQLGSAGYFIADEIARCRQHPKEVRAYLDRGVLRVFHRPARYWPVECPRR